MTSRWSLLSALVLWMAVPAAMAWDSTRLTVPVLVNGQSVPYPVFSIFVMPASTISVGFADTAVESTITIGGRTYDASDGELKASAEPGLEIIEIRSLRTGETCRINVFTLVPSNRVDSNGLLNGYRIGKYPLEPLRGLAIYLAPRGFVEVTEDNADTQLSPNFHLREFVTKQVSNYPKYLVLRSALLLKLENILATLNREGHPTSDLVIMSGYRTPYYNRAIGNVPYSRHVYGGAADFYIDENPADGIMDDMNGDGRLDEEDARWLASFIDRMSRRGEFGPRIGGIGVYGSTSAHGPFVHVDVRGSRARW